MSPPQRFLLLLILVGALATVLGLVSKRTRMLPYPVVLWRWRHVTFWAGLRGALSVALALSVAGTPGVDSHVSVVAYGVVLLSLLVQGTLIAPVMRGLRLESTA